MKNKFFKLDEELDQKISESHITTYMDRIRLGFFLTLLFLSITEFIIYILVNNGLLENTMSNIFMKRRWTTDQNYVKHYLIMLNIINWSIYIVYYTLYKFLDFKHRKFVLCVAFMAIMTIDTFGHSGFIHLSILYTIPIVFACPLGRKYQLGTLISSIVLSSIYTIYQYYSMKTEYNYLVGLISLAAILITFMISNCIYSSFTHALHDIEQYSKLSTKLFDEIGHDYLTGAYSKVALKNDIETDKDFVSIAFIDLDDFKVINDTKGHAVGDGVLKTVVKCAFDKNERIYRYGGDEFLILSKLKVYDLYAKILAIKASFTDTCLKDFDCDVTFSSGIKGIHPDRDAETIIHEADKVMYMSKKNGKDQITVEE